MLIGWLYYRDRKLRPMTSWGLWIPLLWIIILGTREVSLWFNSGGIGYVTHNLDAHLEGNPLERNISTILIMMGILILLSRKINWGEIIKSNYTVFLFFLFAGLSCLWSDYILTAFKRYIKDIGCVIMVMIIFSESDVRKALKAVMYRYLYIATILSVLFIYYFPEYGRYYNPATGETGYGGVTTEKNTLGQFMVMCGVIMVWDLIEIFKNKYYKNNYFDIFIQLSLFTIVIWLLYTAHSSTAMTCMVIGTIILIGLQIKFINNQIKNLGLWSLALLFVIAIFYSAPELLNSFTSIFGKDISLTGRTDLWAALLKQPINPLIGSGFESFWQTPMAADLGKKYIFMPVQAHNGFLETYLQTGLIGLLLLVIMIFAALLKLKKGLILSDPLANLFFTYFIVVLINNWTEASFNKMNLNWVIFLFALLYIPLGNWRRHNNQKPINDRSNNVLLESSDND